MSRLIFKADELRRVVEHALSAPDHSPEVVGYTEDFQPITRPAGPGLYLVHDDGVYLMSNGLPRDKLPGSESSYVVHAKGCSPTKDGRDFCWDNSRALVGGDDFAENLPWAQEIKDLIDRGATEVVVLFSEKQLGLEAVFHRGKRLQ